MPQNPSWYVAAKQYPAVTGLIVLSAIGGMLVTLSYPTAVRYFSFGGFSGGDFWRLITPIFLHFGIVHFIFNSLWLSMLGSRIERLSGSIHLILLVLISGLVSNLAQFWWDVWGSLCVIRLYLDRPQISAELTNGATKRYCWLYDWMVNTLYDTSVDLLARRWYC